MVVISPRAIGGEDTRLEFLSPERGYPKGTGYPPYRSSVALARVVTCAVSSGGSRTVASFPTRNSSLATHPSVRAGSVMSSDPSAVRALRWSRSTPRSTGRTVPIAGGRRRPAPSACTATVRRLRGRAVRMFHPSPSTPRMRSTRNKRSSSIVTSHAAAYQWPSATNTCSGSMTRELHSPRNARSNRRGPARVLVPPPGSAPRPRWAPPDPRFRYRRHPPSVSGPSEARSLSIADSKGRRLRNAGRAQQLGSPKVERECLAPGQT